MTKALLAVFAAVICGCLCWMSSDKCTDTFIAKIRACEEICGSFKDMDDDEEMYSKCLWNGLREAPLIRSYAADCKIKTAEFDKDCYKYIRRQVFFDCSLSKRINETATCEVNYNF